MDVEFLKRISRMLHGQEAQRRLVFIPAGGDLGMGQPVRCSAPAPVLSV